MNAQEYRDALEQLGWSQVEAARLMGINPRTSRWYALGGQDHLHPARQLASLLRSRLV
jgi:Bacterial regulatory protein, Fis family